MPISSVSDLSQSLLLRRDNAKARHDLLSASRELATGRSVNVALHLNGDLSPLSAIEGGLKKSESFLNNIAEQGLRYSAAQAAISSIRQSAGDLTASLMLVRDTSDLDLVQNAGTDAEARFETIIATLNSTAGGASLFAGVALDAPAVNSADAILSQLESDIALSGASTASDVVARVDAWFAPGGGYDTQGYVGGPRLARGVPISETAVSEALVTADNQQVREFLSAFAMAALIGRRVLDTDPTEQALLARESGLRLLTSDEGIVKLQAEIGTQENRVAMAKTETHSKQQSLEMARVDLIGVDPFDAATRLQAAETRLESLYTMTARLSRLSLTDYLR